MDITYIKSGSRMSQAVAYGGVVYVSGQVDAQAADAAGQTQAILASIDALLARAGSHRSRVLSANVWLADIGDFAAMNAVWETWIVPGRAPARATVEAKLAGPQFAVEIAVVAAIGEENR